MHIQVQINKHIMKICSLVQEQQRAMFIEKCSWKCKIAFWWGLSLDDYIEVVSLPGH